MALDVAFDENSPDVSLEGETVYYLLLGKVGFIITIIRLLARSRTLLGRRRWF